MLLLRLVMFFFIIFFIFILLPFRFAICCRRLWYYRYCYHYIIVSTRSRLCATVCMLFGIYHITHNIKCTYIYSYVFDTYHVVFCAYSPRRVYNLTYVRITHTTITTDGPGIIETERWFSRGEKKKTKR